MTVLSTNKYLQTLLENIIATHETEINYSPVEIEIDRQLTPEDIQDLLSFVTNTRKRLFIFKLQNNEQETDNLSFKARRSFLNQIATTLLKQTSSEPKINPLKKDLNTPPLTVRAGIQIQKSFTLPKHSIVIKNNHNEAIQQMPVPDLVFVDINLPELPILAKQLNVLGIKKIHHDALEKIKEHLDAFTDGIIPSNLPKGFYINAESDALCYTNNPHRLPSALAPVLEKSKPFALPTLEQAKALLSPIPELTIAQLLNDTNVLAQKNALISVLPSHAKEITSLSSSLKTIDVVSFLAKQFILGGEAHTSLFIQLLKISVNKNLSIEFLKDPEVQKAFLTPRGLKNFQKLLQLPAEQREWWNTLATEHLKNNQHRFDFNGLFEAYTQIFLPRIVEKNLTLPQPCPIQHKGHLLITLNRVLEVLDHSENPQEQCLNLAKLDWSPLGVHYAMTQAPKANRFKQVAACMQLKQSEDTLVNLEDIAQKIDQEEFDLKPWLFRYMGQHWKKEIRLTDIQEQLDEVQNTAGWSPLQKNQLSFILACCFAEESPLKAEHWKKTLKDSIGLLQTIDVTHRNDFIQFLTKSFNFKPTPSLIQIQQLIELGLELKNAHPDQDFKTEILTPLISCLENEGFELINTLQARAQKIDKTPNPRPSTLATIASFTKLTQANRQRLSSDTIKLLAALNEPESTQEKFDELQAAIDILSTQKDELYVKVFLGLLAKINISKSQTLPTIEDIKKLLAAVGELPNPMPPEHQTTEKQEEWFKDLLIEKNLLAGYVLGSGDISKLDDLIIEALAEGIKKRIEVLNVGAIKKDLQEEVATSSVIPLELKKLLSGEVMDLLNALDDLIKILLQDNPQFDQILEKFALFDKTKDLLLGCEINFGTLLGKSKGEFLLGYVLSGTPKETDKLTRGGLALILNQVHQKALVPKINAWFTKEENRKKVKDLDAETVLKWFLKFNDTHSLIFLFQEELVEKKVLPALRKTLAQLDTQDPVFNTSILQAGADLAENLPSSEALKDYKVKIESIASYLNLLIDIKANPSINFSTLFAKLNTGSLSRLNFTHKKNLLDSLLNPKVDSIENYLGFAIAALEEANEADATAISRAIDDLETLFGLDLEPKTQEMFFKMSMAHNLKSPSPFPLTILNKLKTAELGDEETKSLIIKQIIQILSKTKKSDSPDLIRNLIEDTLTFLTENPTRGPFCIALLNRVSLNEPNLNLRRDLSAYSEVLTEVVTPNKENKEYAENEDNIRKLIKILTVLANNRKDDSVNLPTLLEITKGLKRRPTDLEAVAKLFDTPPYPIAQRLNSALFAHDSKDLLAYCQSFDTNPFATTGDTRELEKQFSTDRIAEALINLKDLMNGVTLPHSLQLQLAKQLTYIETLGYTDPLNPLDYTKLKNLTAYSRPVLKEKAKDLLDRLRSQNVPQNELESVQLELLAYLREIYFRSTGLFPNTTQMLIQLLALQSTDTNLLMRIKTGEGKSLVTPIFAVMQWAQGGTVDVCTANKTLLTRDYENSCEPFFKFLDIKSACIQADSEPEDYQLDGINCSTVEDMSLFRLAAKEAKKEHLIKNNQRIHLVLDECDDALLDQTTLYKLVAEIISEGENTAPEKWVYPLAYQFVNLDVFRNLDPNKTKVWDEEEDLEQFRLFINNEISTTFKGDADKLNFIMGASNIQLKQWLYASCKAATLKENKHFVVRTIKQKDELGNETTKKVCVPLVKSTPKTGCIFTDGVQQALQARLIAEDKDNSHYYVIDADPPVLSSQSARGLIQFYQDTKGRILGISGTPGDSVELQYLSTILGTQAIGVAPHAGDKRKKHEPIFTFSSKDTIRAIHQAIDSIKRPVDDITLKYKPHQTRATNEERDKFLRQADEAERKWSHTQTQPILIVTEDFDKAKEIGESFQAYSDAGFTIQIVTGKESPEELERIIKNAGQANTITIGTAMLARGIDINPGDHPEGLFVIQAYPDSKRITTQIAGRAARNGKPGQWLPIYQMDPPQNWFKKIIYFIFPWYRQQQSKKDIKDLQIEIKLQANIDRLYTQAIDQAQQTLIQQVQAWESLLLELYPKDGQVLHDLYLWRETLLNELTQAQETNVSQETLESSIAQFQNAICKIWETAKEEKWVAKAQSATDITIEQSLRLSYLKQLDLTQELKAQRAMEQKAPPFKAASQALMHQNLQTVILDKAGVVLEYTQPSVEEKAKLELAQNKQLLPYLLGELCSFYPQEISELASKKNGKTDFLTDILKSLIYKVNEQKNIALFGTKTPKQIIQDTIQLHQNELKDADMHGIQDLLERIKPLILNTNETTSKFSLVKKFKMQGLILTFSKLYEQSGLPIDPALVALKTSYSNEIMKTLAVSLLNDFAWVKKSPEPIHSFLERDVGKKAALIIYDLAEAVRQSPDDENKIQALYAGLQEQRLNLQDKLLFSIRHKNPRHVINMALNAIDSLNITPHCDREFQVLSHDAALSKHHLNQFSTCLDKIAQPFKKDQNPVWDHLHNGLKTIIQLNQDQTHILTELYETVVRFSTYNAYRPYKNQLRAMKEQLTQSITALQDPTGLKQDNQSSLFERKATQFAQRLQLQGHQVRIQSGCDSLQTYIEVQIENYPLSLAGFTGYHSSYLGNLENEKTRIKDLKETFVKNRDALINLSDPKAIESLSPPKKNEFATLFKFKALLDKDWTQILDKETTTKFPENIRKLYEHIQQINQWDWPSNRVQTNELRKVFADCLEDIPTKLLEDHSTLCETLEDIRSRKIALEQNIQEIQNDIRQKKAGLSQWKQKLGEGLSYTVNTDVISLRVELFQLEGKLSEPTKKQIKIAEEEKIGQEKLTTVISSLSRKKIDIINARQTQAKLTLDQHVIETSKKLVESLDADFKAMDASFEHLNQSESQKSRFQTRRFANITELLTYEASEVNEEQNIPKAPEPAKSKLSTLFSTLVKPKDDGLSPAEPPHHIL